MRKKCFVLFLILLMCMSGSAVYANAKTSTDFTDLQNLDAATRAKFDALISAGVFDGVGEGEFGLNDKMNRAQFAKVAALIFNLKVDASVNTSSFKDVKADDPANGYALPFIEAVKAAGIADGYGEGIYDPAGAVTKEQLATFLIRGLGLGKDAQATPGVKDSTVSDWAKGYVALALEKKLLSNGTDGTFGGKSQATRDLLVLGAYEAKGQYVAQVEEQKKLEEEQKKKEEEQKKLEEERKKKEEEQKKLEEERKKKEEEQSWYPDPQPVQTTVETPTALPAGGAVTSGTRVTLTSANVSAAVYYTTDLSEPTTSSTLYTGPIIITSSTTIKAIAVKPGSMNSSVARFEYTVTMPIVLPEDSISNLTVGQPFTGSVAKQSGGTGAVTYAVTNGILPVGLTLNPSTGLITGTPSVSGDYNFTISATDSATPPATVTMQYTGTITPATTNVALDLINAASASGSWTNVDAMTFANAGVTDVTSENLSSIKIALEIDSTPYPRTVLQIQTIVNETIQGNMVYAIFEWLRGFESAPTEDVFTRAGITGVTDLNLNDILAELERAYLEAQSNPFGTPMSTRDDIQSVINLYLEP
ncbi:chitobiase/beta-hexosaminidase C-terminal domain-containing protein [Lysinibacillus sp. BW-2-10]|uniref:chitobiase/beta-hexosaminidase C-terminal domain-containing protein n=1 Tax=Lysinibacillus sp. BW-2-10 TaxID=2590030 RepID=UPI0016424519|nr:chitobiase/beta-hexosaminidase C-terminal domain-containing protein [Lysinibacillus sp. BW-2-10]